MPALEKGWHGKPANKISWLGILLLISDFFTDLISLISLVYAKLAS